MQFLSGSPLPPLMSDGEPCLAEESSETLADLSERHRQPRKALTQAAAWSSEPVSDMGEKAYPVDS
ncbi:hypothetical protein ACWEO4_43540 [Streptomyces sp. NPDC004393]|uniref:hypothetical protein n=1 Tax=Streptomyces sp. NPDC004533 TaxID=3154278 RepID=UPI0033AE8955